MKMSFVDVTQSLAVQSVGQPWKECLVVHAAHRISDRDLKIRQQ